MEKIRNSLLACKAISTYEAVLDFMRAPSEFEIDSIVSCAPSEIRVELKAALDEIAEMYSFRRQQYERLYAYGQTIIWSEIIKTFTELEHQQAVIKAVTLSPDCSNYANAVEDIKKILVPYSKMQIALSDLEDTLGVDRFLDRISEGTFSILRDIVDETKIDIEKKCEQYKDYFQTRYDNSNVYKAIAHSLIRRDDDNQICDNFSCNNEQEILFVIDGFGFCQYLWNRGIDSQNEKFTFSENLFSWLSKEHLSREYILGSSYITDTGAGLSQIYLGRHSKETKIFASKIKQKNQGAPFIEAKRIDDNQFDSLFSCPNSITDIVSTFGKDATVYYCSKYSETPSGFSKSIFKSANVKQVVPSERVFAMLLEDLQNGQESGLQIVYTTGIDNSGHTMGAYSGFERQEHKKIDGLLKNFLIELAFQKPEMFDSKRSILITADHGMFESSKIMVTRYELINYLNSVGARGVKLVENNRAMLFYNEGDTSNDDIMQLLKDYFKSKNIMVDVRTSKDNTFSLCLGNDTSLATLPDIVARFIGSGLFYSNSNANEHLLHLGGHGGSSVDEVFVPFIEIPLSRNLYDSINERFLSKK